MAIKVTDEFAFIGLPRIEPRDPPALIKYLGWAYLLACVIHRAMRARIEAQFIARAAQFHAP